MSYTKIYLQNKHFGAFHEIEKIVQKYFSKEVPSSWEIDPLDLEEEDVAALNLKFNMFEIKLQIYLNSDLNMGTKAVKESVGIPRSIAEELSRFSSDLPRYFSHLNLGLVSMMDKDRNLLSPSHKKDPRDV